QFSAMLQLPLRPPVQVQVAAPATEAPPVNTAREMTRRIAYRRMSIMGSTERLSFETDGPQSSSRPMRVAKECSGTGRTRCITRVSLHVERPLRWRRAAEIMDLDEDVEALIGTEYLIPTNVDCVRRGGRRRRPRELPAAARAIDIQVVIGARR